MSWMLTPARNSDVTPEVSNVSRADERCRIEMVPDHRVLFLVSDGAAWCYSHFPPTSSSFKHNFILQIARVQQEGIVSLLVSHN